MTRRNSRLESASAEAARQQESRRLAHSTVLERIIKALELGRRGRQMRDMIRGSDAKDQT